jgi:hypothetical protein
MNRNYLIGFLVAVAVLSLVAFALYSLFEIHPMTRQFPPSREAKLNEYLALDRWLESYGISVKVENSAGFSVISAAEERHIFIQSSLFRWTDESARYRVRWVEEGGNLFIAMDEPLDWIAKELILLLEEFGVRAETKRAFYRYDPESPVFDRNAAFEVFDQADKEAVLLKDIEGITRLVQVKRGEGKLTVSGQSRFLFSENLSLAPNARLAWAIFAGARAYPEDGWLFIRGKEQAHGFFGSLFREGNFSVLLASLFVLLAVSFWAVIPVFGLVKYDGERSAKPLRERFLAEGRFLKKHGALELYRQAYIKEIKRQLTIKRGLSSQGRIEDQILEIWGKPSDEKDRRFLLRAFGSEPFTNREFSNLVNIFKSTLERI